jgi:selenide,water dikinase
VLDGLPIHPNPQVQVGIHDADDAAILTLPKDKLLVQTIDGFRAFIEDLYTFGRILLVHAASDIFAMGGGAPFCVNYGHITIRCQTSCCR